MYQKKNFKALSIFFFFLQKINFDLKILDLGFSITSLNKHMENKDCQRLFSKMMHVFLWLFSKAMDHWKGYIEESASPFLHSFPTTHSQKQATRSLIWLSTTVMFILAL